MLYFYSCCFWCLTLFTFRFVQHINVPFLPKYQWYYCHFAKTSRLQVFYKKVFWKFAPVHLCRSLFSTKLNTPNLKLHNPPQVFSFEFAKFFRTLLSWTPMKEYLCSKKCFSKNRHIFWSFLVSKIWEA